MDREFEDVLRRVVKESPVWTEYTFLQQWGEANGRDIYPVDNEEAVLF